MPSTTARISGPTILAVLLFETLALFLRAWLQSELQEDGRSARFSADVSYLLVPPLLIALAWPLLRRHRTFLGHQFSAANLTLRIVLLSAIIGVLLRVAWWAQLIGGGLLGIHGQADLDLPRGPSFRFDCPPAPVLWLYLFVMALLVPVTEETIHRGFVLHGLLRWGPLPAAVGSSVIFGLRHDPSTILPAMVGGGVLAIVALRSRFIWPGIIAHLTYNGIIALDWICLQAIWNPRDLTPLHHSLGAISILLWVACIGASLRIAWRLVPPLDGAPAPAGIVRMQSPPFRSRAK
ncbi:MAG: CPBP family intramembrane glutamic endopeptidase [Woeseiaceae bacterium]|nr:CPBP family intramembrane glutamic endopeptidase [Woeseiaceae bacterium]